MSFLTAAEAKLRLEQNKKRITNFHWDRIDAQARHGFYSASFKKLTDIQISLFEELGYDVEYSNVKNDFTISWIEPTEDSLESYNIDGITQYSAADTHAFSKQQNENQYHLLKKIENGIDNMDEEISLTITDHQVEYLTRLGYELELVEKRDKFHKYKIIIK
jgi:hypothetical protein